MRLLKFRGGLLIFGICVIAIFATLPLASALKFGGDEGFEVMKAFLRSQRFELYRQIWDDQPPLFTLLLDWSFRGFGSSILTARCVSAVMSLVLFVCFFDLVRVRAGSLAAWIGSFLLIASPYVLELSVSVMQEAPAFGVALFSAWLLFAWPARPRMPFLVCSGMAMGLALATKLIAALTVPAILLQLIYDAPSRASGSASGWTAVTLRLCTWSGTVAAAFGVVMGIWGAGSFETALKAHGGTGAEQYEAPGHLKPGDFSLSARTVAGHADVVMPAIVGFVILCRRRKMVETVLPLVWLACALLVVLLHRPWWMYYYLHLAVPLAWLAGVALAEAIRMSLPLIERRTTRPAGLRLTTVVVIAAAALALARSLGRFESTWADLRSRPRVDASQIIHDMRLNGTGQQWVYAEDPIYAFHCGLRVPPELAVVTLKRFWAGEVSSERILQLCRRYEVEQVLLTRTAAEEGIWSSVLQSEFTRISVEGEMSLYVHAF